MIERLYRAFVTEDPEGRVWGAFLQLVDVDTLPEDEAQEIDNALAGSFYRFAANYGRLTNTNQLWRLN